MSEPSEPGDRRDGEANEDAASKGPHRPESLDAERMRAVQLAAEGDYYDVLILEHNEDGTTRIA